MITINGLENIVRSYSWLLIINWNQLMLWTSNVNKAISGKAISVDNIQACQLACIKLQTLSTNIGHEWQTTW